VAAKIKKEQQTKMAQVISAIPSITTENYTLSVLRQQVVSETNEVSYTLYVGPEETAKAKAEKEGGTIYTATASIPVFGSMESFYEIVSDPAVQLSLVNSAIKVKAQNKFRGIIKETGDNEELVFNFDQAGVYDMTPLMNEAANTRKSTMEKILEQVATITPSQRLLLLRGMFPDMPDAVILQLAGQ
jgi:hypothetical protein